MGARKQNNEIAARYAGAFFELMLEKRKFDTLDEDIAKLSAAISQSQDLLDFVKDNYTDKQIQLNAFTKIAKEIDLSKLCTNFIKLLIEKKRLSELPNILKMLSAKIANHKGEATADLVVAGDVSDEAIENLRNSLAVALGVKQLYLHVNLDTSIIGGAILKFNSIMIDNSVKSKIERLKHQLQTGALADNTREVA